MDQRLDIRNLLPWLPSSLGPHGTLRLVWPPTVPITWRSSATPELVSRGSIGDRPQRHKEFDKIFPSLYGSPALQNSPHPPKSRGPRAVGLVSTHDCQGGLKTAEKTCLPSSSTSCPKEGVCLVPTASLTLHQAIRRRMKLRPAVQLQLNPPPRIPHTKNVARRLTPGRWLAIWSLKCFLKHCQKAYFTLKPAATGHAFQAGGSE